MSQPKVSNEEKARAKISKAKVFEMIKNDYNTISASTKPLRFLSKLAKIITMRGIKNQLKSNRMITTLFLTASGAFCAALSGTAYFLSAMPLSRSAGAVESQESAKVNVNVEPVISLAIDKDVSVNLIG